MTPENTQNLRIPGGLMDKKLLFWNEIGDPLCPKEQVSNFPQEGKGHLLVAW